VISFDLTSEQQLLEQTVRDWGAREIAPRIHDDDRAHRFDRERVLGGMASLGLLGICVPQDYGGAGMDYICLGLASEELEYVDTSLRVIMSVHAGLNCLTLLTWGSEEQKRRYLVPQAQGKKIAGYGLTEPGAGSDAGGTATTAVDKGDHYLLNGSKIFITHAGVGEIFSVTARTEPGRSNKGITSFIVTKDTVDLEQARRLGVGHDEALPKVSGVRAGKKEDKMGWRASDTRELIFEDAVVPKENLLGQPGQGFINFLKTLDAGRIGIAALSLGIAEGAYDQALHYAGVRKQFGRPIGSFQGINFQLADMALEIEAGTHLLYHAAWLKQNGRPFKKEAAMAKLFCSELAMRSTTKAVQIFGGYGYTTEYPVERMMRDAKVCEIGEGTSEIQRMVIARQILGQMVD
jgi:butyryl-CoA dehydrogenase